MSLGAFDGEADCGDGDEAGTGRGGDGLGGRGGGSGLYQCVVGFYKLKYVEEMGKTAGQVKRCDCLGGG